MPPSPVRKSPPEPAAANRTASSPATPSRSEMRPPITAGPMLRQVRPSSAFARLLWASASAVETTRHRTNRLNRKLKVIRLGSNLQTEYAFQFARALIELASQCCVALLSIESQLLVSARRQRV